MREYLRNNVVRTTNGRILKGKKRPRPNDKCELCGKTTTYLAYHHWDDANLMRGVWTCRACHTIIEAVDHKIIEGIISTYLILREKTDFEFQQAKI